MSGETVFWVRLIWGDGRCDLLRILGERMISGRLFLCGGVVVMLCVMCVVGIF